LHFVLLSLLEFVVFFFDNSQSCYLVPYPFFPFLFNLELLDLSFLNFFVLLLFNFDKFDLLDFLN